MPHFQEIMGFEIQRAGDEDDERRLIFSDAAMPQAYRGTVTRLNAGQGVGAARVASIQVEMVDDLAEGDSFHFLRGGRSAALFRDRDALAMQWMPLEYVAAYDPGEAAGAFDGLDVVAQPGPLVVPGMGTGPMVWDVDFGENTITVNAAPTVEAPTATFGENEITVTG